MNNEEEIINRIKRFLNREEDAYATGEDIQNLLKLYQDKKEETYVISKASYMVGVLDERNEWYKKINEIFKYKEKLALQIYNTTILKNRTKKEEEELATLEIEMRLLKELIGKEE